MNVLNTANTVEKNIVRLLPSLYFRKILARLALRPQKAQGYCIANLWIKARIGTFFCQKCVCYNIIYIYIHYINLHNYDLDKQIQ